MTENESYWMEQVKQSEFFILDRRDNVSIGVSINEDSQFRGMAFYKSNTGWEFNPTKIGKGFISLQPDRFDFTKSFTEAISHSDQTKPQLEQSTNLYKQ